MKNSGTYRKIEIDNAVCNRRFHVGYEEGAELKSETIVRCPHCQVPVFRAENHPEAILLREENLVNSPDGSRPIIHECQFSCYK